MEWELISWEMEISRKKVIRMSFNISIINERKYLQIKLRWDRMEGEYLGL